MSQEVLPSYGMLGDHAETEGGLLADGGVGVAETAAESRDQGWGRGGGGEGEG